MQKTSTNVPRLAAESQMLGLDQFPGNEGIAKWVRAKAQLSLEGFSKLVGPAREDHASLGCHQRDFVDQGHKGRLGPS